MAAMRVLRVGLLVAVALAAAGCGTKKQPGSVSAGAEFAPASVPLYVSVSTDPNGSQWKAGERLLSKFPGREMLFASARKDLKKQGLDWNRDVKPALPDTVQVVFLDFANNGTDVVGYARPKDEIKFNKLLESGSSPAVHRKIDGWTVFADKSAILDRFASARVSGDSLSSVKSFRDAIAKLPSNAAIRGWVSGSSVQAEIDKQAAKNPSAQQFKQFSQSFGKLESASFSAGAEDQGVNVQAAYQTSNAPKLGNFSSELVGALPSGALVYVSFGNLQDYLNQVVQSADSNLPQFQKQRSQIEQALGFSLKDDLFPLFSKEGAVAVYRGGELLPNVVFALRVPDESKAQRVIDRLAALADLSGGKTATVMVKGVTAKEISDPNSGISVIAAVTGGKAFVTNSKAALEQALGGSKKLSDDSVFRNARQASGAPDKTTGFIYVNLRAGLPYLFDFAQSSQPGSITPDVRANTKPLDSVFFYGKQDGDRVSVSGFLTIK